MNKELLIQIYNTLNQIEVKGFDNIDKMFGVLYALQREINSEEKPNIPTEE